MAPTPYAQPAGGVERVRARVLTALHFGNIRPGDRVPSVRRLATMTGMNRKTVHRAYTSLADEGILDVRPSSGTFVADRRAGVPRPATGDLLDALDRCRDDAAALGLHPATYARLLTTCLSDGLRGTPVTVAECNGEQVGIIAGDLTRELELDTRRVLLSDLERDPDSATRGSDCIVTTDCHLTQVAGAARATRLPVHVVSLDPALPQQLARLSQRGPVVMIVRDASFGPVFLKLLGQLRDAAARPERFSIVEPCDAPETFDSIPGEGHAYISPLVARDLRGSIPARFHRLRSSWHVLGAAVERLRIELALDQALKEPPVT